MKSRTILKSIRVIIAVLVIIPFTFLFIDFAGFNLNSINWLAKIQLTPALMATLAGISVGAGLILVFVLTLLFGRVYCSIICPLGIMQDGLRRFSNLFKSKKQKRQRYTTPLNIFRYSLLALCAVLLIFTILTQIVNFNLFLYLDPYSNFGRIAQNLVRPVYIEINNLLAGKLDNSSLYYVSINYQSLSFWFSFSALIIIAVFVFLCGRLICNSICPVGALLSLISRYSIFKLDFDKTKCNKCGLCEFKCKSQCINSKQQTLDFSRCVACYNCVSECKRDAMSYKFSWGTKTKKTQPEITIDNIVAEPVVNSRRRFLGTALATVGAVTMAYAQQNMARKGHTYTKDSPIAPPGAKSIAHLKKYCTACHLCVAQCPTQVIKPAFTEYGFSGLMLPRMDYTQSFCNFECTICSEVCPNEALQQITVETKRTLQIGKVYFKRGLCVVVTDGTDCGACSEHCPTKAVDMVPYRDGLRIPEINQDICIGCGGCEFICPVRPLRAIYVDGNPVHEAAQKFEEEEKKDIQLDDFGF